MPNLSNDMILPQAEARVELTRPLLNVVALGDAFWFVEGLECLRRLNPNPGELDHWDANARNWAANTTLAQMMEPLHLIAGQLLTHRCRDQTVGSLILMLVSFGTRGTLTGAKVAKIIANLQPSVPFIGDALSAQDVRLTWVNFGHHVDDGCIPAIMRRWLGFITAQAIRLHDLLKLPGLDSLHWIPSHKQEHPRFPWAFIIRMYPAQWEAAAAGVIRVGNNPYYGYRRDLTEIRSTQFRDLAAFCGRLLIASGDRALENYRGFVDDSGRVETWRRLIDAYIAARAREGVDFTSDINTEEGESIAAMVATVGAYPANIQKMARMEGHPNDGVAGDGNDGGDGGQGAAGGP